MTGEVVITIDGPAGTGKSTVAHRLASRLGLEFLDTGAMYRAAALLAIEQGIDPSDGPTLAAAVERADLHFDWNADPPRIMLGDREITARIRDLDVSACVSIVAGQPALRRVMVERQRAIARQHPRIVTEGRDQGSVVFPNAALRFYLDADPRVRAQRRVDQLALRGKSVSFDAVLEDILSRDRLDGSRSDGPLIKPDGALVIDTSCMKLDEVVDRLEREVRARVASRLDDLGVTGDQS